MLQAFFMSPKHTGSRSIVNILNNDGINQCQEFHEGIGGIIESHIYRLKETPFRMYELITQGKNVYSLRDPLSAMITGLVRQDCIPADFISEWMTAKILMEKYPGYPVRIDLNPLADLRAVYMGLNLKGKHPTEVSHINKTPFDNSDLMLREAYYNKDFTHLMKYAHKAIDQLIAKEEEFRPWLESHGYSNLLWWH